MAERCVLNNESNCERRTADSDRKNSHALHVRFSCRRSLRTLHWPTQTMVAQAGSSKILPVSSEFDNYNGDLQSSAFLATKASTLLPPDITFHRSVDNGFGKLIDSTSEKALGLTNRLLTLVSSSTKTSGSRGKGKLRLGDQADVADRFESLVVDALDQLLENAVSPTFDARTCSSYSFVRLSA